MTTTNPLINLATQAGLHESAFVGAAAVARRANEKAFAANQRSQASTGKLAAAILAQQPPIDVEQLTTILGVALSTAAEDARRLCEPVRPCHHPPPHPDGTGRVTVEFIIGPISD